jgi:hypothetical protein
MNSPLRQFLVILAAAAVSAAVWLGAVQLQMGMRTGQSEWVHGILERKLAYARAAQGRKILIASGSNSMFGISAAEMEKTLGMPTVNLSLSVMLGLHYILDMAEREAAPGDIVILPLEYAFYVVPRLPQGGMFVDYVLARDHAWLERQPWRLRLAFLLSPPCERIWEGLGMRYLGAPQRGTAGYISGFNANGDYLGNVVRPPTAANSLAQEPPERYLTEGMRPSAGFASAVDAFLARCRAKGVTVFAAFPTLMREAAYGTDAARGAVRDIEEYWSSRKVPMLGDFEASLFDRDVCYDIRYHLTAAGRELHTAALMAALRPRLAEVSAAKPRGAGTADAAPAPGARP